MSITDAPAPVTRRDLAERGPEALDRHRAEVTKISRAAGGVTFATALEVMDFAKLMSTADLAIPKHLRLNPGACLRIVFQAVEWQMSPWAVADKSYEVNQRIAYESQLIHAVIEARAPLQRRLSCVYEGEGPTRTCKVIGQFTNGDEREYTSPKIGEIKVKNSPLWVSDPDQQLWYFASRSWARKWCPDVLMGIYSREEILELEGDRDEANQDAGLHTRLKASETSAEGHNPNHAESELANVAPGAGKIIEQEPAAEQQATEADKGKGGKKKKADKDAPAEQQAETDSPPKTTAEYVDYASAWIKASTSDDDMDMRWAKERALRNNVGMTSDERRPLEALMIDQREKIGKKE